MNEVKTVLRPHRSRRAAASALLSYLAITAHLAAGISGKKSNTGLSPLLVWIICGQSLLTFAQLQKSIFCSVLFILPVLHRTVSWVSVIHSVDLNVCKATATSNTFESLSVCANTEHLGLCLLSLCLIRNNFPRSVGQHKGHRLRFITTTVPLSFHISSSAKFSLCSASFAEAEDKLSGWFAHLFHTIFCSKIRTKVERTQCPLHSVLHRDKHNSFWTEKNKKLVSFSGFCQH